MAWLARHAGAGFREAVLSSKHDFVTVDDDY
jgi:hypothetical protein